jgi:ppGpp synthetase/RelA/SpoT-type nucleotidyltranferase
MGGASDHLPMENARSDPAKVCRSSTALSRMQDIAGTRLVVPSLDAQDLMVSQILDLFAQCAPRDPKDTREEADSTGYRAVHIIIALDERLAEIQVRTLRQDAWAQVIEDVDARADWDLKHGRGPAEWRSWFQDVSDEFRKADLGLPSVVPPAPYDETGEVEE